MCCLNYAQRDLFCQKVYLRSCYYPTGSRIWWTSWFLCWSYILYFILLMKQKKASAQSEQHKYLNNFIKKSKRTSFSSLAMEASSTTCWNHFFNLDGNLKTTTTTTRWRQLYIFALGMALKIQVNDETFVEETSLWFCGVTFSWRDT